MKTVSLVLRAVLRLVVHVIAAGLFFIITGLPPSFRRIREEVVGEPRAAGVDDEQRKAEEHDAP